MIYLMRHGQDDESYIGGWSNVELIQSGIEEVNDTARWILNNLNISSIESSDVHRALQTASIVGRYLNLPVSINVNLREQNKGDLNGVLRSSLSLEELSLVNNKSVDIVYPNGESLRDLYIRMKVYLEKIFEMEEDTLLITHRGVINMIYYILYDIPIDMNKKQFGVSTASVHELDKNERIIKKVR